MKIFGINDTVQDAITVTAVIEDQAKRLQAVLDAINSVMSYADEAATAASGERFWILKEYQVRGFVPLADQNKIQAEKIRLHKRAKEVARDAFEALPHGTVIIAKTAYAWHTGCPHIPGSVRKIGVSTDPWNTMDSIDKWWSVLADGGVENSDNGRARAVLLGDDWEILSENAPSESKKGWPREQYYDTNLYRQGGDYPGVTVVARKVAPVRQFRDWWTEQFIGESYGAGVNPLPILRKIYQGEWKGDGALVTHDGREIWKKQ